MSHSPLHKTSPGSPHRTVPGPPDETIPGQPHETIPGPSPGTLVILTPGFPKDEEDSTCLPAQQLFVKALNSQYPDLPVIILAFEYPFSRQSYRWHGNRVIPFDGWNKGKLGKAALWISVWRTLRRLKREGDLLGLLSFWCTGCALVGKYFGRQYGLQHFIWILGQDARANNRYMPFIRPRAAELVAMSDSLAREFNKHYSVTPEHIVPNGVDTTLYSPGQPSSGQPSPGQSPSRQPPSGHLPRDIDVLGVGSLIPLKQFDIFLSIIRQLSADIPDLRAVICGKGPEEPRLRASMRELGLEDRVHLAGEQPHDKVLEWMQRSRVLLHTSNYEGFSTVCLEALYAGAHVVSFCQPLESVVRHWHIAANREEMVRQALAILQDPGTEHGKVLVYSMEDSAKKMMGLFGHSEAAASSRSEAAAGS